MTSQFCAQMLDNGHIKVILYISSKAMHCIGQLIALTINHTNSSENVTLYKPHRQMALTYTKILEVLISFIILLSSLTNSQGIK